MLMQLDPVGGRPVYRQIADEVTRCVAVGVFKPEEALPAVRRLASDLKVNVNTVQHAYRTLEQEGTVKVRRGLGTFVVGLSKESRLQQRGVARQIAEKMLREGYRHGLLASDLIAAMHEIAPGRAASGVSGPRREEEV